MKNTIKQKDARPGTGVLLLMLPALAQNCLLVPVPLAARVGAAPLVVEAAVTTQAVAAADGHLYTLSELTVCKVFRGTTPALLHVAEAGGTLGLRR